TAILAGLFFVTSILLVLLSSPTKEQRSIVDEGPGPTTPMAPSPMVPTPAVPTAPAPVAPPPCAPSARAPGAPRHAERAGTLTPGESSGYQGSGRYFLGLG